MVISQIDDDLIAGAHTFLNEKTFESKSFMSKPRKPLNERPILVNEIEITCYRSGKIFIRQQTKVKTFTVLMIEREFRSKELSGQYIGVNCRPDVCASIQLIAP